MLALAWTTWAQAAAGQSPKDETSAEDDARAQEDETRSAARKLGEEGLALYDRGDCPGALAKLDRAEALFRAPTLMLYAARCLVRLGRLVEASEKYLAAARLPLDASAPSAFRDAQATAARERAELLPTIPRVEVAVEARDPGRVRITLDGAPLAATGGRGSSDVDPGAHEVVAEDAAARRVERFEVARGERRRIALSLSPPPPPRRAEVAGSGQRVAGWIALAGGAAGLGVGAVTGALALGQTADLDRKCGDDRVCPGTLEGELGRYGTLKTVSTVGFVAGAVLGATGVVLLLTAPRRASASPAEIAISLGPRGVGARGRF